MLELNEMILVLNCFLVLRRMIIWVLRMVRVICLLCF